MSDLPSADAADAADASDASDSRVRAALDAHWRRNLWLMAALLALWAFAGLGCGVLLADWLNRFSLGGFPLGFWFAQQGSILVFVLLVLVYALAMRRLDRVHHQELEASRRAGRETA